MSNNIGQSTDSISKPPPEESRISIGQLMRSVSKRSVYLPGWFLDYQSKIQRKDGSDLGLKPREFLLLVYLLQHDYIKDMSSYPSPETLATKLNEKIRNIYNWLASARDAGFINILTEVIPAKNETPAYTRTTYDFNPVFVKAFELANADGYFDDQLQIFTQVSVNFYNEAVQKNATEYKESLEYKESEYTDSLTPEKSHIEEQKTLSHLSDERNDEAGALAVEEIAESASIEAKSKAPITEWVTVEPTLWQKYPNRKWFKVLSDGKPLAIPQAEQPPEQASHRKRGKHGKELEAVIGRTVWVQMMPMTFMAYFTERNGGIAPINYNTPVQEKEARFAIIRNEWKGKDLSKMDCHQLHTVWQNQTEFGANRQYFAYSPTKLLIALRDIQQKQAITNPPPQVLPSNVIRVHTPFGEVAMSPEEYENYNQQGAA